MQLNRYKTRVNSRKMAAHGLKTVEVIIDENKTKN